MRLFKKSISGLGLFFLVFAILIGSPTAVANLLFMLLCYLLRNPLRTISNRLIKNKFLLLVIFGTLLGLVLEALWYFGHIFENKPQPWVSLLDDFIRMFPVYLLLFIFLYLLIKRYPSTEKQAFIYGGIMGYIFYFAMEGLEVGFSPLILLLLWEINNFLLNGFLIWMPLYISSNLVEKQERSVKEHIWISTLLLGIALITVAITLIFLAVIGYTPIETGP
ncbi:MAG: hypothetical protein ACE5NL_00315 [Candidatus Hydrothermarchaeaceae archaeon]